MSEAPKPYSYRPIALSSKSTVVTEFPPDALAGVREAGYQSEAALERAFIEPNGMVSVVLREPSESSEAPKPPEL